MLIHKATVLYTQLSDLMEERCRELLVSGLKCGIVFRVEFTNFGRLPPAFQCRDSQDYFRAPSPSPSAF
jgi:hypothetical protein